METEQDRKAKAPGPDEAWDRLREIPWALVWARLAAAPGAEPAADAVPVVDVAVAVGPAPGAGEIDNEIGE